MGDSITKGIGVTYPALDSYPSRLGQLLGSSYEVRNFGVPSSTVLETGDKPYAGQSAYALALAYKPDVVIIELGTNDTTAVNFEAHPNDFNPSYRHLIEHFQAANPSAKIYLCLPTPVFGDNYGIRDSVLVANVIPAIQQVATETGLPTIDLHTALAGKSRCFPDRVHPNEEGALRIAETVFTGLTGQSAPPFRQPDQGFTILPLGDSLTAGSNDLLKDGPGSGYREQLYDLLSGAHLKFRFLGSSLTNGSAALRAAGQDFHEGHPYYPLSDLLGNLDGYKHNTHNTSNDGYWITGGSNTDRDSIYPDMVLLLAGINDIQGNSPLNTIEQRMTALLDWFRSNRPNTHLFVGTLLPYDDTLLKTNYNGKVRDFNAWLSTALPTKYPDAITVVDLYSLFTDANDNLKTSTSPDGIYLPDGIQPSHNGYKAMGDAWFAAIKAYVDTLPETPSLVVDSTDDTIANDKRTTLREAITYADTLGNSPTISFDPSMFGNTRQTIALGGTRLPDISASMTIIGSAGGVAIDAGGQSDILWSTGDSVTLKNLTFTGGTAQSVQNSAGSLLLEACTLNQNQGAVGTTTPTDSSSPSSLILRNSTLSGNTTAISSVGASTVNIENSTIADNTLGLHNGDGAGTFTLSNSIVSRNTSSDTDSPIATSTFSLIGVDAGLDPAGLQNNGGPTQTIALLPTSPAINAGDPNFNGQDQTDQRGASFVRVRSGRLDIGALETQNVAPSLQDDSYSCDEDTLLTTTAANGVLANDSDPDGDALTVSLVTGPTSGQLTLDPTGAFTYQPNPNFNGTDSFTYSVSNGTFSTPATATITVAPVNDAPRARVLLGPGFPRTTTTLQAVAIGSDIENDPVSFTYLWKKNDVVLDTETGPTLDLSKPGNGDKGDKISVTVTPSDGQLSSASVTSSVTVINTPPTLPAATFAGFENQTLSAALSGQDADQEALAYSVVKTARYGTLSLQKSGTFIYTPARDWNGTDTFQSRVIDGSGAVALATFTLKIAPVNGPPTAVADTLKGKEDTPLTIAAAILLANDSNGEDRGETDPLRIISASVPSDFPGTLSLDTINQKLLFAPQTNWNGTTTFSYTIQDSGKATSTASVTLQIAPVNDAPVAQSARLTAISGTLAQLQLAGSDVEGDPLTFALRTPPTKGAAQIVKVGDQWLLRYQSKNGFVGTDTLSFVARDATLTSAPATITISVTPNASPQLVSLFPNKGTFTTGTTITFEQKVRDSNGPSNLGAVALSISSSPSALTARPCATLWFDAATNRFTLTRDNAQTTFAPVPLSQTLSNSLLQVSLGANDVERTSDGTLTLRWHITFKPAFTGTKSLWSRVEDLGGLSDGFTNVGQLTLPTPQISVPSS